MLCDIGMLLYVVCDWLGGGLCYVLILFRRKVLSCFSIVFVIDCVLCWCFFVVDFVY